MDRLQTLVIVVASVFAFSCSSDGKPEGKTRERSNAVKVRAKDRPDPVAMCDRHYKPGAGPQFKWPKLASPAVKTRPGAWRWVNIWSTWCKPCIEELPRLVRWQKKLTAKGKKVDLVFASADQDAETVAKFRRSHPNTPTGTRLSDPDGLATWIATMGVKGATLPVHVFVDAKGNVRCVRASAVEESDYAAVAALFD